MTVSDPLAVMALQVASALFPSEVRAPGQDCGTDKGQPPGAPCPVCAEQAEQWAARVAEVRAALDVGIPVYWIEPGRVTDPEGPAVLGAPEYQFSDGPAGARSTSCDYLSLAEGIQDLGPAIFIPAPDLVTAYDSDPDPRAAVAKELAETRAALAEVLADMVTQPESGNPWRLHSIRRASELLTGEPLGFSGAEVFRARLAGGTLGGRFKAPYLGEELEPLGRALRALADADSDCKRYPADGNFAARAEAVRAEFSERLAEAKAGGLI